MLSSDTIVFIVDLNDVDEDDLTTVSMDFTVNYGPLVRGPITQPAVGELVRVHSPDEDILFRATVCGVISDRDLSVKIHWDTCAPVLNSEWSAAERLTTYRQVATTGWTPDG